MTTEANVPHMPVKVEIRREKNHGTTERAEHAQLVRLHLSATNERVANQQKYSASRIERGIDSGQRCERK